MRRWALVSTISMVFFVPLVGGLVYYFEAIPARDWNAKALHRMSHISSMKPDRLNFAVFGDNRGNLDVYSRLLDAVNHEPKVNFAIHMGDMVDTGEEQTYRHFIQRTRERLHVPMLTVMGNHEWGEGGRALYDTIFSPAYYSFAIKNCYFIVLDDALGDSLSGEQMGWLERELTKAETWQYRFVFMHIPPFDPRGPGFSHCLGRSKAAPLLAMFKSHRVTHLFAGHIHGYYEGEWEGMHYAITGGAGADFEGNDPAHNFYHYLLVDVDEGREPRITLCKLP